MSGIPFLVFLTGFCLVNKTSVLTNNTFLGEVMCTFHSFGHLNLLYLGTPPPHEAKPASTRRSSKYHTFTLLALLVSRTQACELDCTSQTPPTQSLHKEVIKWHEKQGLCRISFGDGWWRRLATSIFKKEPF